MRRPTKGVGQQPTLWLLFILSLRKFFKLRYLLIIFIFLILATYLRIINNAPSSDQSILITAKPIIHEEPILLTYPHSNKCNFDDTESILHYTSLNNNTPDDTRPKPTVERLIKLFKILISHEDKYRQVFDYLNIFRFTDIYNTLRPYANNTQHLNTIYCHFQRYITISDNGHIDVTPNLITYLEHVSTYLSDGFRTGHLNWNKTSIDKIQKPAIIMAANMHFYETLQSSMRTVNKYLSNYTVAIYDLGFNQNQLAMIKENCQRCIIIPFPFAEIVPVADHVRNLGHFAWKPIIIQDAIRRFGSIIYGDTSIRYQTSNFDHLLIDNLIRGFACRELPGHYLPCFTLNGLFSWFNETSSTFDNVYIAEAGFVAVTDNFLSRLILKTWVTCALDSNCLVPSNSRSQCKRVFVSTNIHRYDQSAMVTILSFYFFPSRRQDGKTDPAPYDMYASIQAKIAEVRRFEGDRHYFTHRNDRIVQQNSSTITTTTTTVQKQ